MAKQRLRTIWGLALIMAVAVPMNTRAQRGTKGPPQQDTAPTPISLSNALKQGLVEAVIKGVGGSTGDVIHILVRREVPRRVRVRLAAGTVLRNVGGSAQDMLVMALRGRLIDQSRYEPTEIIDLKDGSQRTYLVEAYCLDFEKENPGPRDTFTLAEVDVESLALINSIPLKERSPNTVQAALWLNARFVGSEIQKRFPVRDDELATAERAVAAFQRRRQ